MDLFLTDTRRRYRRGRATGRTRLGSEPSAGGAVTATDPRPGGLAPANVRRAIALVRPAGVDVHTGVEDASGRKDRAKLLAFVAEASVAFG